MPWAGLPSYLSHEGYTAAFSAFLLLMSKVSFHLLELQRYLCEYTFVYTGMNPRTTTFSAHVDHT